MHDRATEELSELRARAYGPDADIGVDEAALRRLQELEDAALRAPGSAETDALQVVLADGLPDGLHGTMADAAVDAAGGGHDGFATAGAPAARRDDAGTDDDARGAASSLTRRRWTAKRVVALWIASVVVAVIGASAATWAVTHSAARGPHEVAVLSATADDSIPRFLRQVQGGKAFAEFHGLLPVTTGGARWMGPATDSCLYVVRSSQIVAESDSFAGEVYMGCGAGGFSATVQLRVTDGMPEELRAQFPVGTALQFVLSETETEVRVLSDAP